MSKPWQPYAMHILDSIAKIHRIQARGDLTQDDILYDAILRNLQLYPRPLSNCLKTKKKYLFRFYGGKSAASEIF
jgi:uncharacterized protein with HEPN domain